MENSYDKCTLGLPINLSTNSILPEEPISAKEWSPYMDNGGTVLAIAGKDFVILAGDTRLSYGYSIASRTVSKFTKLTGKVAIISSGMQSDINTLHKTMKVLMMEYQHKHKKEPSVNSVRQFLSIILYSRRFFPYYTFNIIAGLDENGKGFVYGYDAIGSHSPTPYVVTGSGTIFVTSILDSRLTNENKQIPNPELTKVDMIDLVKDCMTSVTERDILTGDTAEIIVIDSSGVDFSSFPIRDD